MKIQMETDIPHLACVSNIAFTAEVANALGASLPPAWLHTRDLNLVPVTGAAVVFSARKCIYAQVWG